MTNEAKDEALKSIRTIILAADDARHAVERLTGLDRGLPWRPISELADKYENELLFLAPELVDLDCNEHGVGMGYWQDDGLLWHMSQEDLEKMTDEERAKDHGCFMACRWSMTNDEWSHAPITPTHYLKLTGV